MLRKMTFGVIIISVLFFIQPLFADLVDNGDGTITDTDTGLMWLKNANMSGVTMTWDNAKSWAENLDYAGYKDWRLPSGENPDGSVCNSLPHGANCTQTEFGKLYFGYSITVFGADPFENIGYRSYWTGTEFPSDNTKAMYQDFEDGGQNPGSKTSKNWVWAVRGGDQSTNLEAPTNLTALNNYNSCVPLAWKAVSDDNVTGYTVYKSTSFSGNYIAIINNIALPYYRDFNVTNGTRYYYKVKAIYSGGESDFSNSDNAVPKQDGNTFIAGAASIAPTIDGQIQYAEWADAAVYNIKHPQRSQELLLFVKNDENYLYFAVQDPNDASLDNWDNLSLFFDENQNRNWSFTSGDKDEGMLRIFWNSDINDADITYMGIWGRWPNSLGMSDWYTPPGITPAIKLTASHVDYELRLDLTDGPLNANAGDEIGILFFVYDTNNSVFTALWPSETEDFSAVVDGYLWSYGPFAFGDLLLAEPAENPLLSLSDQVLDFGTTLDLQTFQISNVGQGTLQWNLSETPHKDWLSSISPTSGSGNSNVTVRVDRSKLVKSPDSTMITVSSNGGTGYLLVTISEANKDLPGDWDFTPNTGTSTIIVLPTTANPNIDGVPLQSGDYIGAFNEAGLCGGWKQWEGENLSLTVWADDSQTPKVDGFQAGQKILYRIFRPSENKVWSNVQVAYSTGGPNYQPNDFFVLSEFNVLTEACRTLNFASGWNMFSLNVLPSNTELETIFSDVLSNITIIKNGNGQTFIPAYSIDNINDIQWDEGYQLLAKQQVTLDVCGDPIPPTNPINLPNGWSLISYLPTVAISVEQALASLGNSIILVKNNNGETYIPAYDINDIGNMQPLQGYQIYMQNSGQLVYPSTLGLNKNMATNSPTEHFKFVDTTGDNSTIIIPTSAAPQFFDGTLLKTGDEIGVFNNDGLCCGGIVWEEKNAALTAWGDNQQTPEIDGFTAGNTLNFKVWKKDENVEYNATPTFQNGNPTDYQSNGISVLTSLTGTEESDLVSEANSLPDKFALLNNFPNPFNPRTTIPYKLKSKVHVNLVIYNVNGQLVKTLVNTEQVAGQYNVNWDGMNELNERAPSGIYVCRLVCDKHVFTKKMAFVK